MSNRMRWEVIIDHQGEMTTNVLERPHGVQCSTIKQVTDLHGSELSDEKTGPDCDDVHEIQG